MCFVLGLESHVSMTTVAQVEILVAWMENALRLVLESHVSMTIIAQVESVVALMENALRLVLERRVKILHIAGWVKPALTLVKTRLELVINPAPENHVKTRGGPVTAPWANGVVVSA